MLRRARDARALRDRDADTARADHEHRRARLDLRRVQHRADAGLHRAADHARDVERRVVGDAHRARRGRHDVLREPADPETAQHRRAAVRESGVRPSTNVPVMTAAVLTQQPYSPRRHQ